MKNNLGKVVQTEDGSYSLLHHEHSECYHSTSGALSEAQNLYIGQSTIAQSLKTSKNINVLDVGLGLAYNACVTIGAWLKSEGTQNLHITSLEINSELVSSLASGKAPWQIDWPQSWITACQSLAENGNNWNAQVRHPNSKNHTLSWSIIIGDAHKSTPKPPHGNWDYIWQDPFSPKKNPIMWSKEWFLNLKKFSTEDTQLISYSVARVVKDGLHNAGWEWEKIKREGVKKTWLKAKLSTT